MDTPVARGIKMPAAAYFVFFVTLKFIGFKRRADWGWLSRGEGVAISQSFQGC